MILWSKAAPQNWLAVTLQRKQLLQFVASSRLPAAIPRDAGNFNEENHKGKHAAYRQQHGALVAKTNPARLHLRAPTRARQLQGLQDF